MSKNEFNRSICFTFFEDYRKTAQELENDFGKEIVADYYNAIIDYALYGTEPELKGAIKYVWHTTKSSIDKSIQRRASGFSNSRENTEQTEKVIKYKEENPNATQREIADATGISVGKVNKVLKGSSFSNTDSITNSTSTSNSISEREHEHVSPENANAKREIERELEDLSEEELKSIISDFYNKVKYKTTKERLNLKNEITKDTIKEVEGILAQRKKDKYRNALDRMGISLDSEVSLDKAHWFATEILKFKVTKEEMQEDMNVHAQYEQPYTWNDFVYPPKPLERSNFYDYTARLCSMLN